MTADQLCAVLEAAGDHDPTVRLATGSLSKMVRRAVPLMPYDRVTLFDRMCTGEPSLFTGFPKPLRAQISSLPLAQAAEEIVNWFEASRNDERYRVYTGETGVKRRLTLCEIGRKWRRDSTRFGVTDLHIRGTAMECLIAPEVLSAFNVLSSANARVRAQEMFSFVISSCGQLTDSHSDDPDSSNYCITGSKLWLAWDSYEGFRHGLQDVDRIPLSGRARFDMDTWLSLPSARWSLVRPGQVFFLPANLTHKVITLERYIGVGGFFVALPNSLRLLAHWILNGPLWSKRDTTGAEDSLLGEVADRIRRRVDCLECASLSTRMRWGYDFLGQSAEHFRQRFSLAKRRRLWADPRFRTVAEAYPGI